MLIHKETKGVLEQFQIDGKLCEATFRSMALYDLNPEDWWEVSATSELGKRAAKYYPDFDVLLDQDGNLLDIVPNATKGMLQKAEYKAMRKKAILERGLPNNATDDKVFQPIGIFDFLGITSDLRAFAKA